jgi:hypothetical protein
LPKCWPNSGAAFPTPAGSAAACTSMQPKCIVAVPTDGSGKLYCSYPHVAAAYHVKRFTKVAAPAVLKAAAALQVRSI